MKYSRRKFSWLRNTMQFIKAIFIVSVFLAVASSNLWAGNDGTGGYESIAKDKDGKKKTVITNEDLEVLEHLEILENLEFLEEETEVVDKLEIIDQIDNIEEN